MTKTRVFLLTFLASSLLLLALPLEGTVADDEVVAQAARQLQRVPPMAPEDSLEAFDVPDGFRLELVAAEPLVRDPVAVDFDERGRMFVVQLPPYNAYVLEDFNERGSVAMLEDTDGDGVYDQSTTFVDGLNYPSAVACWDGGLFVGDAPDLLYMKDTDGDGRADQRRVVMTGFGMDKAGESHLNSIRWGLDNRFHFSTSLSGGDVKIASADDAERVSVRGRGIIFDPRDLSRFELTSGGGQHGMSMDDWGQKYVCANSTPAQTLMYDDRYIARNPHVQAPAAAIDIAPEGKHTHLYRISPPEPWRALRTELRRTGAFRGSDEGGAAFGFFTGATGITVYRGDAWPEQYHGNAFVGEVANNLVYRASLEPNGLGVTAQRADAERDFLPSRDIWFRPVQFANAPDGTLYVLDMYRELIEGAAFLPPEFLDHINAASGSDRGRIYRIAPEEFPNRRLAPPRLDEASTAELVSLLEHPNGWHRDTASRLIYERQDRSAVAPLKALASSSSSPIGRTTALYSLDGLGALDEEDVLAALGDSVPEVRIHALRLAEEFAASSPAIRDQLVRMTGDPELQVRYQLAFSLGSFHTPASAEALSRLAAKDAANNWMRVAILSSLKNGAEIVFANIAEDPKLRSTPHGRELLVTLAEQIGAEGRNSEVAVVLATLDTLPAKEKALGEELVQALVANQSAAARSAMLSGADGKAADILEALLDNAKQTAVDSDAALAERTEAIASLRLAPFSSVEELFYDLLQPTEPQQIQAAALEAIAAFEDAEAAELLLDAWTGLSPAIRASAAETLLARPTWVTLFLDAVEAGDVARGDIDPARVQLLEQHPDKQIAARVAKLFAGVQLSGRQEVVDLYQPALTSEGNAERGKLVFKESCSACHQLEGVGSEVGADLKGIRQRGLPSVLLNVLDPNREVKPEFLTYTLLTDDGRIITGMIASETANSITIRRTDGTSATVQREEIDQLRSTGLSFMPEGLEKTVSVQQMADLLRYLDSLE